ncbi:MAG: gliding motility-associated ABC transporter ATP-binding subunit GldA [Cyclobacteriaceae bacterium]|nr:gliding motility-associated ABC transporter ATP-binding subunit GldA [Cyclobacteriaceae bacterium]
MSIKISNLTKVFGKQNAVDNISFEVEEGEIVGFLGPNGAGKSTTMKIANCYLPPTSGIVEVAGYNVTEQPLLVRRNTGYLPEQNPLYTDMYVHEYLQFAGKIHGLSGKTLKNRVGEMISLCGLEVEQNKKIEALSKGYRQRVGLAQSLIHDPKVLILDEPTTGLDPNQIVEIRNLIKNISKNKTVIFSTHIMQEVQAICNRVIVINKGKIVADDNIASILKGKNEIIILAEFESLPNPDVFSSLEEVKGIEIKEGSKLEFTVSEDIRSKIMKVAAANDILIIGIQVESSNLENIFHQLTTVKQDD